MGSKGEEGTDCDSNALADYHSLAEMHQEEDTDEGMGKSTDLRRAYSEERWTEKRQTDESSRASLESVRER